MNPISDGFSDFSQRIDIFFEVLRYLKPGQCIDHIVPTEQHILVLFVLNQLPPQYMRHPISVPQSARSALTSIPHGIKIPEEVLRQIVFQILHVTDIKLPITVITVSILSS